MHSANLQKTCSVAGDCLRLASRSAANDQSAEKGQAARPRHRIGSYTMSQNYDQNPERADGPNDGPGYTGGPGFGSEPPPPPRRHHKRWLITTAAVALAAGAAVGGMIASTNHAVLGTTTAVSRTAMSTSQIASTVDPALVDVVSTDGDQQATSAGTGIV